MFSYNYCNNNYTAPFSINKLQWLPYVLDSLTNSIIEILNFVLMPYVPVGFKETKKKKKRS